MCRQFQLKSKMNFEIEKKDKLIAVIATFIVAIVILIVLFFSYIGEDIQEFIAQNDIQQEEEIFLDADLLNLGEIIEHQDNSPAPKLQGEPQKSETSNEELVEPGINDNSNLEVLQVTQQSENDLQTVVPQKTEQQESQINSVMRNRFNSSSGNTNETANTNGSGGNGIGATGNLKGRTFLGCSSPIISISKEVTIIVRISVNENGVVTDASFMSDSGPGAGNRQLRNACVKASRNAKWSAKKGVASQTGTITWHLKPKS